MQEGRGGQFYSGAAKKASGTICEKAELRLPFDVTIVLPFSFFSSTCKCFCFFFVSGKLLVDI